MTTPIVSEDRNASQPDDPHRLVAHMKGLLAAERLRKQGMDVVDLGAGEPDFPTPEHVKAAAHDAINANFTKYTPNAGTGELRAAICARYKTDYGVDYAESQVIVTAGGKQSLANVALSLFGAGDEVITHSPGWPTIPEQIKLSDATPVIVRAHADDGFTLHADAFIEAITPRTRGIILNSPCNPTGALISESELTKVARAAAAKGIWVVMDLCYEKLIYEPVPHNLPGVLARELGDRFVISGSASKAYSMTGWRCGWAIGPKDVIAACGALQSHQTSNVCSITQKAVVVALTGPQDCVTAMREEYRVRRDRILGMDHGRSPHHVRPARRRLLPLREHRRGAVARRRAHVRRVRRSPHRGVLRRDDGGGGVRRSGVPADLVRQFARAPARGGRSVRRLRPEARTAGRLSPGPGA